MKNKQLFLQELTALINKHSLEIDSNTPDYIIAEHLVNCLNVFNASVNSREFWYGRVTIPCDAPAMSGSVSAANEYLDNIV